MFLSERISNMMDVLLEKEKRMENINIELKNSKELLKKSYKQLNKIYLNIKDAVFVISEDYKILFKNDTARDIFGTDLIGKDCYKAIKGQDQPCEYCPIIKFAESEESLLRFEQCVNTPLLKEERFFDVISSQIEEYGGQPAIVEILLDITERKKAEEKYRYLFENAQVGLYWSRLSDGKILECNDTFAKIVGYDTRKQSLASYVAAEHYIDPNARSEILEEIRDNKEVKNYEIHVTKRDGTPIWLSISARMFEKENRIEGAAIDITKRKKTELKLKESEEKYREAYNRAEFYKDIFAHDINNILQSILSGTQISQLILDNAEKRDELKLNAEIIKEQVIRGAKLVTNVRKLSQLEEVGQDLKKIEILNVLKNAISFLKKSYKSKNITVRVDSVDENLFVKANDFLEDVFENLLINSIRHNKNLLIDINIGISKKQQNGINYVKMEFLDNGIGIADNMKERIFKRGYSEEKSVYGMGLGLSLVRGIIETYNGKIWVEDRVKGDRSKGSNFVILIPEVD